jgi:hypothetical protein
VRRLAPTLVLAVIWALLVARIGTPVGDFANYYTSAALVLEKAPLDRLYDYRWFTDQAARLGFGDRLVGFAVLTPPSALLAVPVVPLGPEMAARVWEVLEWIVGLGVVLATAWAVERPAWIVGLGIAVLWPSFASHLAQGQVHLFAVLFVALGAGFFLRGRDWLAGACWGLAVGLKIHAWPLLAVAAVARRARVVASAAGVLAIGGVITVAFLGWPLVAQYAEEIGPAAAKGFYTDPWSVTLQSVAHLSHHLFLPHPSLNPDVVVAAPALAMGIPATVSLAAVGATVALGAKPDRRLLAAASMVALATGSILARYHLVLLLPALALAVVSLDRVRAIAFVALLAIAAWCPTPSAWAPGVMALTSVPRFWALLAAWAVVMPWRKGAGIGAAVGVLLSTSAWHPLPALQNAQPLEAPGLPLVAADLVCTEDGTLWFSGLPEPAPDLPGTGWVGYRWPRGGSPVAVAGVRGAHVWSPTEVGPAEVAWSTGPHEPGATRVTCPDGRAVFLDDHGVGVRADRLWTVTSPR